MRDPVIIIHSITSVIYRTKWQPLFLLQKESISGESHIKSLKLDFNWWLYGKWVIFMYQI